MDHGGHGGHDMPMCTMNMLWNTQIVDTCVVFPSWHIRSNVGFVLSFVALVLLSVFYEYLRLFQRNVDAGIQGKLSKGKRAASPAPVGSERSTPERGEDIGLLNGRRARPGRAVIPAHYRALRSALYGVSVLLGCFLMLVYMTYNAYLIFAVVIGAAIGHYFFSGFVEPDGKGQSCH